MSLITTAASSPEIFGPTSIGDERDPDPGDTKHDKPNHRGVKAEDGFSSSSTLNTAIATTASPSPPPPLPTKPSRIYNPNQSKLIGNAHDAHAHPRRNASPDSNSHISSAQAKKIPNLDRENVVLPRTSAVPMVRSTASIGVPAKREEGSGSGTDRSPLGALTSTPTWSFSKFDSSPAAGAARAASVGSDESGQGENQMPGSYPASSGQSQKKDEGAAKDDGDVEDDPPAYSHILKDVVTDDDSDDEMPTEELKAE
ncbi:hypothetical protein KEM56_004534 [Ascosphaera pollenicola]|nr:hypothetical protein KEM56_004534 [Ascosphaera pollenicola]